MAGFRASLAVVEAAYGRGAPAAGRGSWFGADVRRIGGQHNVSPQTCSRCGAASDVPCPQPSMALAGCRGGATYAGPPRQLTGCQGPPGSGCTAPHPQMHERCAPGPFTARLGLKVTMQAHNLYTVLDITYSKRDI